MRGGDAGREAERPPWHSGCVEETPGTGALPYSEPVTQTFWLEPTMESRVGLRVYSHSGDGFDCEHGHHQALTYTGRAPVTLNADGYETAWTPPEDAQWPTACEGCGIEIPDAIQQPWSLRIYRRADTGEERFLHSNPAVNADDVVCAEPGASWNAWWMPWAKNQPDGIYLMVRLPNNHDWAVDSRASNCGSPDDNVHRCWVRHGDPRECHVTVDKDGLTCSAGAGSIQGGDWHGFLRDGVLVN